MSVRRLRLWRMISWPAANGMRWVKPSIAIVSPSRMASSTASARDRKRGIDGIPAGFTIAGVIYGSRRAGSNAQNGRCHAAPESIHDRQADPPRQPYRGYARGRAGRGPDADRHDRLWLRQQSADLGGARPRPVQARRTRSADRPDTGL